MRAHVLAAPPASAPDRDHHRWIRRSPARSNGPPQRVEDLPLAHAPMLEVAGETARGSSIAGPCAGSTARAARSASSRSSDARYCARSPPRLQWIITLLPWTTRSPVKTVARRLVPERDVIRRVAGRVQHGQRLVRRPQPSRRRRAAAMPPGTGRLPPATDTWRTPRPDAARRSAARRRRDRGGRASRARSPGERSGPAAHDRSARDAAARRRPRRSARRRPARRAGSRCCCLDPVIGPGLWA